MSRIEGEFLRPPSQFRDWIRADGSTGFAPEANRYHVYVSRACPWAHRTLILRALRGLSDVVSVSVAEPFMPGEGWRFGDAPGATLDTVNGKQFLREIYLLARSDYAGRFTVPALWDRKTGCIVNNESRDIIRMFDLEMADLGDPSVDLAPEPLRQSIDAMIDANYQPINNGVYRCGFARTQQAYDVAVAELFTRLDACEAVLSRQPYLCGDRLTEADVCLFTTLFRFDVVYHYHFKCNLRRIADYPGLYAFVQRVYETPGVAETCDMGHIKQHYYRSHESINPHRIVPVGPEAAIGLPSD